jgi:hypothetical protein
VLVGVGRLHQTAEASNRSRSGEWSGRHMITLMHSARRRQERSSMTLGRHPRRRLRGAAQPAISPILGPPVGNYAALEGHI